jgi:hypothetical protein
VALLKAWTIACSVVVVTSVCAGAVEKVPPAIKDAQQEYERSVAAAEKRYKDELLAARKKFAEQVQATLVAAMKDGNLDAANALKAVKDQIESGEFGKTATAKPKRIPTAKTIGLGLPGWKAAKASPGTNLNEPLWGGMVVGARWVEWNARIPAKGDWYIYVLMTCKHKEARPCKLSIGGVEQEGDVLDGTTDEYHLRAAKWFQCGPYSIDRGLTQVRIAGRDGGEMPHIRGLYLTSDPDWKSDGEEVLTSVK